MEEAIFIRIIMAVTYWMHHISCHLLGFTGKSVQSKIGFSL